MIFAAGDRERRNDALVTEHKEATDGPFWGAFFPITMSGFGSWFTFGLARDEYRATKIRKERDVPKPGSGYVP